MIEYLTFSLFLETLNALSVFILVIITYVYVIYTRKILKEQTDINRKSEITYKLENVYSPLEYLTTNCLLSLSTKKLNEEEFFLCLVEYANRIGEIEKRYLHIILLDKKMYSFMGNLYKISVAMEFDKEKILSYISSHYEYLFRKIVSLTNEIEGDMSIEDYPYIEIELPEEFK